LPTAKVSPARAAAFDILLRVETEQAYASELLHSARLDPLSIADRALTTELVFGVERWRSRLDSAIRRNLGSRTRLDPEVMLALRLGAYQLGFLERVPARAAIYESVELVKRARKGSAAPLVNAVLRKLSADRPAFAVQVAAAPTAADIARELAHPEWLVQRWAARYGLAAAQAIGQYDQQPPVTAIRLRGTAEDQQRIARELERAGLKLAPGALLRNARRVLSGDVTRSKSYQRGDILIQDEASQLVAALVGRGKRVLDCCAAPGGKTAAIADRNPESQIIAAELHRHRARLLERQVQRKNVSVITADARSLPLPRASFDRVLADVPCSGTGTLARNPEIKWRLSIEDLADLHSRQLAILLGAAEACEPGGKLIYSTCSLEPEENEQVIEQALAKRGDLRLLDCRAELQRVKDEGELAWDDVDSLVSGRFLRTIPGVHPCDGFFAAVLERSD
jgi:16S rRNA (cytosine967-C5)-methyltransferase